MTSIPKWTNRAETQPASFQPGNKILIKSTSERASRAQTFWDSFHIGVSPLCLNRTLLFCSPCFPLRSFSIAVLHFHSTRKCSRNCYRQEPERCIMVRGRFVGEELTRTMPAVNIPLRTSQCSRLPSMDTISDLEVLTAGLLLLLGGHLPAIALAFGNRWDLIIWDFFSPLSYRRSLLYLLMLSECLKHFLSLSFNFSLFTHEFSIICRHWLIYVLIEYKLLKLRTEPGA
jgi:hypothetical protein